MSDAPAPKVVAKGLEGVVATATAISDVRGLEGQLIYRGYDIHELAGKVSLRRFVISFGPGSCPTESSWRR